MTLGVRSVLLIVCATSAAGCVIHRVEVQPVNPAAQISIVSPVKVHLRDGSVVVYAPGVIVIVTEQTLRGRGMRYNYALTEATQVESVPLEMVVGMERFATVVNRSTTIMASIGTAWLAWMASWFLLAWAAGYL